MENWPDFDIDFEVEKISTIFWHDFEVEKKSMKNRPEFDVDFKVENWLRWRAPRNENSTSIHVEISSTNFLLFHDEIPIQFWRQFFIGKQFNWNSMTVLGRKLVCSWSVSHNEISMDKISLNNFSFVAKEISTLVQYRCCDIEWEKEN